MKTRNHRSEVAHDGPAIKAVQDVTTPTLVGICIGSALFILSLAVIACFCYKRRSPRENEKNRGSHRKNSHEKPLVLPRKPSAVRSPNGAGTSRPILRKSPSPPSKASDNRDVEKCDTMKNCCNTEVKQMAVTFVENEKDTDREKSIKEEKDNKETEKEIMEKDESTLGKLYFELKYSAEKCSLLVTICKCTDLPPKDQNIGTCDPYVKLQLLPEKQYRVKTRVLRKTVNPVYGEDFTFYGINPNQLQALTLHFVVLSFDRYSRDDIIGEVICPMGGMEMENLKNQLPLCKEISPRNWKIRAQGHGELLVSLCHQPAANRLTVVVLKARNLPKLDITGLCDPYVKIYLLYNNQRIAKKKTHVKKRTVNPVFNESFLFDVPFNEGLDNVSLEFLLLDWDRVTKNEVIGRLEIGNKTTGTALHHWKEVFSSPRRQIAEWHKLRE